MYNAGLAYQLPSAYITLEYGRTANLILTPTFQELKQDLMPSIKHVPAGINFAIETTSPSASPMNKKANEVFAASNADGLFVAAGPSSASRFKVLLTLQILDRI